MKMKTGLFFLIVPVFLLYFVSEAFLRCAAVANINPEKVNLDKILNELPDSVRDIVTYRIMHTDLTNALAKATDEEEKLSLLAQLGEYSRDLKEKENIFRLLRKTRAGRQQHQILPCGGIRDQNLQLIGAVIKRFLVVIDCDGLFGGFALMRSRNNGYFDR